jgi:hypothetical protein
MNNNEDLKKLFPELPIISPNRKYWLVRTFSGDMYESFVENNFIAIGWNEITANDLFKIHSDPKNKVLRNSIAKKIILKNESQDERGQKINQSRALNQMIKFAYKIKKGDLVIIPSENSDKLSFGEVIETPITNQAHPSSIYKKQKSINWILKNRSKFTLDANLYKVLFAHQTVNDISDYSIYINNTLYDFYMEGDRSSLVLRVKKHDEIDPIDMAEFYSEIISFIYDFSEEQGYIIKRGDLEVKFSLQSPGLIIFAGLAGLGLLALFIHIMAGGEYDNSFKIGPMEFKLSGKTEGFLDALSKFRNKRLDRDIKLMKQLNNFEVVPPKIEKKKEKINKRLNK